MASAFGTFAGHEVTASGFVMAEFASAGHFEPLSGTFSCLQLGHR